MEGLSKKILLCEKGLEKLQEWDKEYQTILGLDGFKEFDKEHQRVIVKEDSDIILYGLCNIFHSLEDRSICNEILDDIKKLYNIPTDNSYYFWWSYWVERPKNLTIKEKDWYRARIKAVKKVIKFYNEKLVK